jgi:chromosome partitioning protein
MTIITLGSNKGGVGKTAIALELAAALDANLVDLDGDAGGATGEWGYTDHRRRSDTLTEALSAAHSGDGPPPRAPRAVHAPGRCALVPCDANLQVASFSPAVVAQTLRGWAAEWNRPVVVDTHPGVSPLTYGAMAAADLVVVPVPLRRRDLTALEGLLDRFAPLEGPRLPLAVVPNLVPKLWPNAWAIERVTELTTEHRVPLLPELSEYGWWENRRRRGALTLLDPVPAAVTRAVEELRAIVGAVRVLAAS